MSERGNSRIVVVLAVLVCLLVGAVAYIFTTLRPTSAQGYPCAISSQVVQAKSAEACTELQKVALRTSGSDPGQAAQGQPQPVTTPTEAQGAHTVVGANTKGSAGDEPTCAGDKEIVSEQISFTAPCIFERAHGWLAGLTDGCRTTTDSYFCQMTWRPAKVIADYEAFMKNAANQQNSGGGTQQFAKDSSQIIVGIYPKRQLAPFFLNPPSQGNEIVDRPGADARMVGVWKPDRLGRYIYIIVTVGPSINEAQAVQVAKSFAGP